VPVVEAYAIVIVLGVCIRRKADTSVLSSKFISIGMDLSTLEVRRCIKSDGHSSFTSSDTSILGLIFLFLFLLFFWFEMYILNPMTVATVTASARDVEEDALFSCFITYLLLIREAYNQRCTVLSNATIRRLSCRLDKSGNR